MAEGAAAAPDEQALIRAWFETFHERFSRRWPLARGHENWPVTAESLLRQREPELRAFARKFLQARVEVHGR